MKAGGIMINRKILLCPDETVHGITNYIVINSFEDLNEYMDLIQSEEMYTIELIVKDDSDIDTFFAVGYLDKNSRVYEIELLLKNNECKAKVVEFEEMSALIQQLLNNEIIEEPLMWESLGSLPAIGKKGKEKNHDEILTIKYLKKSNLKTAFIVVGILFVFGFLMALFELGIIAGLILSFILSIVVGFFTYIIPAGRLMHMVNQQESMIGYKIDEVFKNENFTIGDFYSGRSKRNSVFFIDSTGEVILIRACVDEAALKRVIFSRSPEKKVTITLVNGAKVKVRMPPKCAEEIQRWIEME